MENELLLRMIDGIILRLGSGALPEDLSDGWTPEIQERVIKYFKDIRKIIEQKRLVEHVGIVRSLDFDGVCRGDLICEIAQVMKVVRGYNNEL